MVTEISQYERQKAPNTFRSNQFMGGENNFNSMPDNVDMF